MIRQGQPVDKARDEPPSADEDVAKLRLQLRQKSVEELVDDGLVSLDRENNVVVKGPHFGRGPI
jgi:hypothetical protein